MIAKITTGEIKDITEDGKNAPAVGARGQGAGGWNDGEEALRDRQEGRKNSLGEVIRAALTFFQKYSYLL
jgi:hypothetical protein